MFAGSATTAIPSIATMFSTAPALFSSSFKFLEELPMSTLPARTLSIPAEEPVNSAVTVTLGYFSMKLSATAFASFSMEVEPDMLTEPERSAYLSALSALVSAASSAAVLTASAGVSAAVPAALAAVSVAAVLPQPARVPTASALIVRSAISLFFIMFLLLDAGSILFRADE